MGKPGPKQVPVTAKIQKSTVGGVVQPSLPGMGSIAKMKKAPMKKSLVGNQDQLPANLQASIKAAPGKTYGSPAKQGGRSRGGYNTKDVYKSTDSSKPRSGRAQTRARDVFKGAAAKGAEFATKGAAKSSKKVTSNTNAGNAKSVRGGFFGTDDYKKSVSAGNKEANSDNARRDFTANLKNQTKTKVKTLKAIKTKGVEKVSAKPKAPKLAATSVKPKAVKPTKKQVKKSKSVKRKTARAAKTRRKGIEALESGNLAKAKRLNRREARINKRIEKKKSGQASKAIKPE